MKYKLLFIGLHIALLFFPTSAAVAASPANLSFNLWPDISYSFVASDVRRVQQFLLYGGYLDIAAPTGYFGDKTSRAVKKYQTAHDLEETGIIGSLTRRVINKESTSGRLFLDDPQYQKHGAFPVVAPGEGVVLPVPLVEQKYPLSCEAASLEMALLYKGISKSQDELISAIGVAHPKTKIIGEGGEYIWGDPNIGFVGDIRGWLYTSKRGLVAATGWGVNNGPVARVAATFRAGSTAKSGGTLAELKREVSLGNPVIVWQQSSLPKGLLTLNTYKTDSGGTVRFVPTHVKLVVGFRNGPSGDVFLINDPEYGRIEMNADVFEADWSRYNRDMVVVK